MNKNVFRVLAVGLSIGLASCASMVPTPFVAAKKNGGYGVAILEKDGRRWSVFSGNQHTSSMTAFSYAILGAYLECARNGELAMAFPPVDVTNSTTYTQVNSYTTYSRYSGPMTSVYSYPVTVTYPRYAS